LSKPIFRARKRGLYVITDHEKKWVAPFIKVVAFAKEENNDDWFAIVKFRDLDRKRQRRIIPRNALRKSGALADYLTLRGYDIPVEKSAYVSLMNYLATAQPAERLLIVRRTGWVNDSYVFPEKVFPTVKERAIEFNPAATRFGAYAPTAGTLNGWKETVAGPGGHSSRVTFGIGVAFASICTNLVKGESGGFHLVGPSTKGKTTSLLAACSVARCALRHSLVTWDVTATALDELAAEHCDSTLCLDELARISEDPKHAAAKARDASFRLASGQGKIRSVHWGEKGNRCTWRVLFLSSGEVGISELAAAAGKNRLAGDQVRLIDIPAVVSPKNGIFETLPKGVSAAKLSERIEAGCADNYGIAAREFVQRLTADMGHARIRLEEWREKFHARAGVPQTGWERRFAQRFGLTYAALLLAVEFDILPWTEDQVERAIISCYQDARRAIPDFEKLVEAGLRRVRKRLISGKDLIDLRKSAKKPKGQDLSRAIGFIKSDEDGHAVFLLRPALLKRWIGETVSPEFLVEKLAAANHLQKTSRKIATKQVLVAGIGKKLRYYCIKESFIRQ
jgi:putative DNA primase/helicase